MPTRLKIHLLARDPHEEHRAATPLELMFDLASVIAIAAAATGLHHALAESHFADGIMGFFFSFFMIWLAWMNYTWFASAYDNGGRWFQVLSMGIMLGSLVLAAGIPAVFAGKPLYLALVGFIIMRLGLVALWIAAARGNPSHRTVALRYGSGIAVMQAYWIAIVLLLPPTSVALKVAFLLGFAAELAVPALAERHNKSPWHRHHIIERYGLLNIIVLGECFLAIVLAFRAATGGSLPSWHLVEIGLLASIITFSLWAFYFAEKEHLVREELRHVLLWGYGHFAIFASAAAAGAGFAVMVEHANHHAQLGTTANALSVGLPVAVYVFTLWLIRDRYQVQGRMQLLMPTSAFLIVAAAIWLSAYALLAVAVILVTTLVLQRRSTGSRESA